MEILDTELVNCEIRDTIYQRQQDGLQTSFSPPLAVPVIPISTSSFTVFHGYGRHRLFQLYIFVVTFLFKEFIKAQYLYTLLALFLVSE